MLRRRLAAYARVLRCARTLATYHVERNDQREGPITLDVQRQLVDDGHRAIIGVRIDGDEKTALLVPDAPRAHDVAFRRPDGDDELHLGLQQELVCGR